MTTHNRRKGDFKADGDCESALEIRVVCDHLGHKGRYPHSVKGVLEDGTHYHVMWWHPSSVLDHPDEKSDQTNHRIVDGETT
jgi:hypothetical protein